MKNRGLMLAVWVIAVFSVCCAFISVRVIDMSNVSGKTHSVQVSASAEGASGVEVLDAVTELANVTGTTIAKEVADLDDSGLRHLYLAIGDPAAPEAAWLVNGYPWFSPDVRTEAHEMGELREVVPPGTYVVFGGERTAEDLVELFHDLGYGEAVVGTVPGFGEYVAYAAQDPVGVSYVSVMLLVGFLVATSVVAGVSGYSVQRLHGAARATMVWRDLRLVALPVALSMVTVGVLSTMFLSKYNDLHQWQLFSAIAAGTYASLVAVVALAYLVAFALISRAPILDGIKGRVPWRGAATAVYLVRAPALVIVISSLAGVLGNAAAILDYLPTRSTWADAGSGVTVAFGGSAPVSDMDSHFAEAGEWIRDREVAGDVVLALPTSLADGQGDSAIIVNDAYLARHSVLDEKGVPVGAVAEGAVAVLLPADRSSDSDAVVAEVRRVLQRSANYSPASEQPRTASTNVAVQMIQPGQQVFTYVADPDAAPYPTFLRSPVVIVVNGDTEIIAADDYASYASQGRLIFKDIESAQQTIPPDLARDFVDGYRFVAQDAAEEYSRLTEALKMSVANAMISLVLLVITALTLGQLYTRSRGTELLVQYLHGWAFDQMHRRVLRAEGIFGAAVLAWSVMTFINVQKRRSDAGAGLTGVSDPLAWGYLIAFLLVVASVVLVMSVIAVLTRRMVRSRTDEEI